MYFVTYQPSSQVVRVARAVNTVNTTDSSVLIGDLDSTTEYTFTMDVSTAGGKLRSTLAAGQSILHQLWDRPIMLTGLNSSAMCGPMPYHLPTL